MKNLKELIAELKEKNKDGLLRDPSPSYSLKLEKDINSSIKEVVRSLYRGDFDFFSVRFRKAFKKIKKEIPKRNVGIASYKLKDLNPKFEKAYKVASLNSLRLIKTQNEETMVKLRRRFADWMSVQNSGGKNIKLEEKDILPDSKHMRFILRDQTNKLSANIDNIVAKEYEAIAFQWKTRNDNRVVGKPGGKYPDTNKQDKTHGNHWDRRDKFFYYAATWATKAKLLELDEFVSSNRAIPDGMPGVPIGCRCWAKNYYRLADLPAELISERGKEYLKHERI